MKTKHPVYNVSLMILANIFKKMINLCEYTPEMFGIGKLSHTSLLNCSVCDMKGILLKWNAAYLLFVADFSE